MVIGACAHGDTPAARPLRWNNRRRRCLTRRARWPSWRRWRRVARAALLRQPLPAGSLAFRPDAGGQLVALDPVEQAPPAGTVRRLFVFADTVLAFAGGGCLRMTVLVGTTGFRVGTAKFVKSCEYAAQSAGAGAADGVTDVDRGDAGRTRRTRAVVLGRGPRVVRRRGVAVRAEHASARRGGAGGAATASPDGAPPSASASLPIQWATISARVLLRDRASHDRPASGV